MTKNIVKHIEWIANHLQLSTSIQEAGVRTCTLICALNLHIGRRGAVIAAASLYIACRSTSSPYLLVDFAEVLHIRVAVLGQVYMKIAAVFADRNINIPMFEPRNYLDRFLSRLDVGTKLQILKNSALRLLYDLGMEATYTCRCLNSIGVVLLVASVHHKCSCSAKDISKAVGITEKVLRLELRKVLKNFSDVVDPVATNKNCQQDSTPSRKRKKQEVAKDMAALQVGGSCSRDTDWISNSHGRDAIEKLAQLIATQNRVRQSLERAIDRTCLRNVDECEAGDQLAISVVSAVTGVAVTTLRVSRDAFVVNIKEQLEHAIGVKCYDLILLHGTRALADFEKIATALELNDENDTSSVSYIISHVTSSQPEASSALEFNSEGSSRGYLPEGPSDGALGSAFATSCRWGPR